jgi:hypothetical protein
MEIIIITSIVVAVFGAVALAWVLSQGGTSSAETPEAGEAAPSEAAPMGAPTAEASSIGASAPEAAVQPETTRSEPDKPQTAAPRVTPMQQRPRSSAPERSAFDDFSALADFDSRNEPIENIPTPKKSSSPENGSGTALNTRPGFELEVPGHPLRLNAIDLIASQIETLYEEYVRLDEERSRLAQELLTNMLFEKIERTSGRLEIVTEQSTLDLRKELIKVTAEYERVQFRLGALQHLNARLGDPRVAHQIEELVMSVRSLAGER